VNLENHRIKSIKLNFSKLFLICLKNKKTIYIFQRLVKAFSEGAYSVRKQLKQIHHSKQNSDRIFKETIG